MSNPIFKRILPHIIAYLVMVGAAMVYFAPAAFSGKVLYQSDNVQAAGASTELNEYRKETGVEPLWTNAMFGGMPAYQIHTTIKGNFTKYFYTAMLHGQSILKSHFVILMGMLCCYFLMIVMRIDWRIALFASITYGISTYNLDLAETGHSTKLTALAILPTLFASVLLAYRGKMLLGAALFGLFTAIHLYSNHFQITYYAYILIAIYGILQLIKASKTNTIPAFAKTSAFLIMAAILGVLCNTSKLWPTQEYAAETIRGKSELTAKAAKGDGLDKEYLFAWSVGIGESMTLLVPQFKGGGLSQTYKGTKLYDRLYKNLEGTMLQRGLSRDEAAKNAEQQISYFFYHGEQTFVGMAIYFGAIVCFLFMLGAFLVPGELKWWLVISGIVLISIAWGENFFMNHVWYDYFPFFNKFRSLSMALGLGQLIFIALAALGLQKMVSNEIDLAAKKKALMAAVGITGGLCLVAVIYSLVGDLSGNSDGNGFITSHLSTLLEDRASIIRSDAFRSLALILISAGILWALIQNKFKAIYGVMIIAVLSMVDVWMVGKRSLRAAKFEDKRTIQKNDEPLPVDKQIMDDDDPHYRVLDLATGNFMRNARTSFFHKSMGGYHAAKLQRYQELVENYLSNPGQSLHLLGMLNTKYIIQGEGANAQATLNPKVLGNAWFVNNYQVVKNGDEEMAGLKNLDPATTALIQKSYASQLGDFKITPDPSASIELTSYHPDKMKYSYNAASDQLAVFSEVFYPPSKGWNMYLDGNLMDPFVKANYLLRAAKLPAGQHELEMRFEPRSYYLGENISRVASLLLILGTFAAIFFFFKKYSLPQTQYILDAPTPRTSTSKKPLKATESKKAKNKTKTKSKKKKK